MDIHFTHAGADAPMKAYETRAWIEPRHYIPRGAPDNGLVWFGYEVRDAENRVVWRIRGTSGEEHRQAWIAEDALNAGGRRAEKLRQEYRGCR